MTIVIFHMATPTQICETTKMKKQRNANRNCGGIRRIDGGSGELPTAVRPQCEPFKRRWSLVAMSRFRDVTKATIFIVAFAMSRGITHRRRRQVTRIRFERWIEICAPE